MSFNQQKQQSLNSAAVTSKPRQFDFLTANIFYCQTNRDNGSDTSYKLTRSSPLHINH